MQHYESESTGLRPPCFIIALLSAFLLGSFQTARAADPAKSPIAVSIVLPFNSNGERVLLFAAKPYFHVLVSNVSDEPQNIWKEWCSWGYFALSFEITEADGKTSTIRKLPHAWTMNGPDYWTIPPHEHLVIDVYSGDGAAWEPFPHTKGERRSFTLTAVFEIAPDKDTKKYSVWSGRVVSKPVAVVAYDPR